MVSSAVGSQGAEDEAMSTADTGPRSVDLDEAARQLEQAAHDAEVACDSIRLGNLDWAHTNAITARAAVDAAENALRAALQIAPDGAR
jgi:hypothetical protein